MDCTNKNCPAYAKCLAPYRGSRCKATRATYGLGDPITNADRIRGMTDEELARFIAGQIGFWCNFKDPFDRDYPVVLEWLKQEVSE